MTYMVPKKEAAVVAEPATAAVHPLAVSPEEGLFAVPPDAVITQCQKLLSLKYATMLAYINYGDRIRAHFRDAIYEHWKEHTEDERNSAYTLAMKITALGGEPDTRVAPIPSISDLHQMMMQLLQFEKQLLAAARELVEMAGDNIGLRLMAEDMALTDAHHADDLRRMFFCEQGTTTPGGI